MQGSGTVFISHGIYTAMKCLAIESTAHTFGAAVVESDSWNVLSNVRRLFTTEEGGLIPTELSEHHVSCARDVVVEALEKASLTIKQIDLIAFSQSPGIGHALRIGGGFARCISIRHNIPLVGVNHCVAHLEIGRVLGNLDDPVLLYASGANTQVIALENGRYRVFGETLDVGVGNFLDSVARDFDLGFPGGPKLEALAKNFEGPLLELPYAVKGMDVSFTGMQTKVSRLHEEGESKEALAYAIQEHAFAMLLEVSERALAHTKKQSLVLGGGVACNERLQEMCERMCADRKIAFFVPEKQFLVDNAAMIAILGIKVFEQRGQTNPADAAIQPYLRTEEFLFSAYYQ